MLRMLIHAIFISGSFRFPWRWCVKNLVCPWLRDKGAQGRGDTGTQRRVNTKTQGLKDRVTRQNKTRQTMKIKKRILKFNMFGAHWFYETFRRGGLEHVDISMHFESFLFCFCCQIQIYFSSLKILVVKIQKFWIAIQNWKFSFWFRRFQPYTSRSKWRSSLYSF